KLTKSSRSSVSYVLQVNSEAAAIARPACHTGDRVRAERLEERLQPVPMYGREEIAIEPAEAAILMSSRRRSGPMLPPLHAIATVAMPCPRTIGSVRLRAAPRPAPG